jgi:hypothetical protein
VVEPGGVGILAHLTNQFGRPGRFLTIFAAVSFLAMPVDYKGGAELAHAHGLFQFWLPGGHAEIDFQDHHHGRRTNHDTQPSGAHQPDESRKFNSTPDRPTISEMGSPAEKASGIASSLLLAVLAIFAARRSPSWWHTRGLIGLVPDPELPPPRNLASASS